MLRAAPSCSWSPSACGSSMPEPFAGQWQEQAPCSLWSTSESHGNSQFIPGSRVPRVSGAQFTGQGAQHHHRPAAVLGTDQKPSQGLSEQMQEKGNSSWSSCARPGLTPLSQLLSTLLSVPLCFIPVLSHCVLSLSCSSALPGQSWLAVNFPLTLGVLSGSKSRLGAEQWGETPEPVPCPGLRLISVPQVPFQH